MPNWHLSKANWLLEGNPKPWIRCTRYEFTMAFHEPERRFSASSSEKRRIILYQLALNDLPSKQFDPIMAFREGMAQNSASPVGYNRIFCEVQPFFAYVVGEIRIILLVASIEQIFVSTVGITDRTLQSPALTRNFFAPQKRYDYVEASSGCQWRAAFPKRLGLH